MKRARATLAADRLARTRHGDRPPLAGGDGPAAARAGRSGGGRSPAQAHGLPLRAQRRPLPDWTPGKSGLSFALPATLEPLAPFKDDLLVLTGLAQQNAEALGDGPGDHARSLASFLTGAHPLKTDGAGIRAGSRSTRSPPQKVGRQTRLPSLELGIDRGAQAGNCDSGYSCAYSSNISWRSANMPMAKEINPRLVFDRLFAAAIAARARRPSGASASSTRRASSTSSSTMPSSFAAGWG